MVELVGEPGGVLGGGPVAAVDQVDVDGGAGQDTILLGARKPVLIATPSATVRRLVNLTALAAVSGGAGGD